MCCFFFSVATGLVLKFKLKYASQYGGGAVAQHFFKGAQAESDQVKTALK